jgi:hypothetical protein
VEVRALSELTGMGRKVKEYMALKRAIFQELSEWVKQQL